MNELESKNSVLYSSVIKLLKDDNVSTGNIVKEINFYVGSRIIRKNLRQKIKNPKILIDILDQPSDLSLPSGKYVLSTTVVVNTDDTYALTELDNISARVEFLLNKKSASLNLAYSSKNLRCRLINKVSGITSSDLLKKIHQKVTMFDVTLDDETL